MDKRSIDDIRSFDRLLSELLDLDARQRSDRLEELHRDHPVMALKLRRAFDIGVEEGRLHAAGALDGVIAQECLLGRSAPLVSGTEIGPYRIEALLGRGGMAYVYEASRHFDGFVQRVALKLMRSGQFDHSFRTRLLLEQRALVRLDHPNIARFLDAGLALNGDAYLAMELVEGTPITAHANDVGADLRGRVCWVIDLCAALSHAHGQLIVHCDIKPSNVLVDRNGRLRLLDFGIARIMGDVIEGDDHGDIVKLFTPDCAAPEQLTNSPVTTATDIFQVGALLYRLIVGKPWLTGSEDPTRDNLWEAITQQIPLAPSRQLRGGCLDPAVQENALACGFDSPHELARKACGSLDAIILKCLRKQPVDRYSSIEQLSHDLQNWLRQRPVSVNSANALARFRLWLSRNRRIVAFATLALGFLAAMAFVSIERIGTERAAKALEQERALAVERFLAKVILQASPYLSAGQDNALGALSQVGDSLMASEENLDARTRMRLIAALGRLEMDRGRLDLAERRARNALKIAEETGVREPDAEFELRRLLGSTLARQDRLGEAIAVFEAKSTQASALALDPLRRAQFGTLIGHLHSREGRLANAAQYFEPAYAVLLGDNVPMDSDQLDALHRLLLYIHQSGQGIGRLDPIAHRLALSPGARESSILRARRLMLLSYLEVLKGLPTLAGEHAQEAASIFASTLGENHPQVTKARANACVVLRDGGSLALARQQCNLALQSLRKQDRASSDDAIVALLNLTGIEFSSGNFVAAQVLLTSVWPTLSAKSKPYEYAFASILQGRVHYRRGQPLAALKHFQGAVEVQRKHYPDHVEFAVNMSQYLASALASMGRPDDAQRALAASDPVRLPPGLVRDRLVADGLIAQGQLAAAYGQRELAKARIDQGLKALWALSSLSSNERAWALLDAGEVMVRIGESAAALDAFEKALGSGLSAEETPALWAWAIIRLAQLSSPNISADQRSTAERIRQRQFVADYLSTSRSS